MARHWETDLFGLDCAICGACLICAISKSIGILEFDKCIRATVGDTPKFPLANIHISTGSSDGFRNSTARLFTKKSLERTNFRHRRDRSPTESIHYISTDDKTYYFVFNFRLYRKRGAIFMHGDMAFLDQKEITHFLAQELFYQQFITFEGLNSGVPTRTTPTLTPTTLRNIEQTFIELQSKSHENEAGFYISAGDTVDNSTTNASYPSKPSSLWHGSSLSQSSSDCDTRSTPPLPTGAGQGGQPARAAPTQRRNMGGRKPVKDVNCSPEEEERKRIRRERNKAAAARCRKRRVDHTNALIAETEELEHKKQDLQDELQQLRQLKDQLEYILDAHQADCRMQDRSPPDVKPFNNNVYGNGGDKYDQDADERVKTELSEPINDIFLSPSPSKRLMLSGAVPVCRPSRPSTLNVATTAPKTVSEVIGAPLTTPSTGMMFNFESLMGGGTGLTPVNAPLAPSSCGTQQRNHVPVSMADMASPDAGGPPKLE
ncbi:unnamed protein product [Acanthoscelides obtectus]|uniref:BZIP domain-containing protein n=1 Tax=Acanthoscelides obtectus TaxID=200917 RepID=A0A9P0K3W1_ACAOB|nr:unnamed protein product [Acanthoscelides obtectus]